MFHCYYALFFSYFSQKFSIFQIILQKFHILPVDFSIPGDELTPTMKVKCKVILAKYHDLVAEMYNKS